MVKRLICLIKGHWYYDCICARCGKHMGSTPIKTFFKRIVCLIKGHKWEKHRERTNYDPLGLGDEAFPTRMVIFTRCKRCGKILKDVP